jgi:hypothetical protein
MDSRSPVHSSHDFDSSKSDRSHLLSSISSTDISPDVFLSLSLRLQLSEPDPFPFIHGYGRRVGLLGKMPTLTQKELDEILGTGYASRVLVSPFPLPSTRPVPASEATRGASKTTMAASARAPTPVSATNHPTPRPHIPTASLVPHLNLNLKALDVSPVAAITDSQRLIQEPATSSRNIDAISHSFTNPESQINSRSQLNEPGDDHSTHRSVSALNSLLQPSPAQKALNHRTLDTNGMVRGTKLSNPKQVSQTLLAHNGRRGAAFTLPCHRSNRNTEPSANVRNLEANDGNLLPYEQSRRASRFLIPQRTSASPRASHTSRVLAFNRVRNLHVDRSDAPSSDRVRRTSLIATSRSIAVVIQTPPTPTEDTQLLALSYDESVPRNKWTEDQRWTLAFMRRTFHNSLKEQLQIFNTMFAEDLSACGLRNGITSPSTLESQWRDMKAGKEGYKYWAFFNINFAHWDRTLADLQGRIQKAAHQNNIILDIRLIEESNVRKHGHRQNWAKNAIRPHGLKPYLKSSSDIDSATFPNRMRLMAAGAPGMIPLAAYGPVSPEVSSPSNVSEVEDNLDLTPTGSRRKQSNTPPKLAYRFFNLSSAGCNGRQFICGALTEAAAMPPRDPDSEEFKLAFIRHMTPDPTWSPFISTFASCLPPIHRAMSNRNAARYDPHSTFTLRSGGPVLTSRFSVVSLLLTLRDLFMTPRRRTEIPINAYSLREISCRSMDSPFGEIILPTPSIMYMERSRLNMVSSTIEPFKPRDSDSCVATNIT